jgi:non-specific protein-tyrosine kinase
VIPTGTQPPSPADFVASPSFGSLINAIEAEADLVILDAPPVQPVSDALSISRHVDAVIVVAKVGKTTRDRLTDTLDNLRQVGANVIGVCLTDTKEVGRYGTYTAYSPDERDKRPRQGPDRVVDVRQPDEQTASVSP